MNRLNVRNKKRKCLQYGQCPWLKCTLSQVADQMQKVVCLFKSGMCYQDLQNGFISASLSKSCYTMQILPLHVCGTHGRHIEINVRHLQATMELLFIESVEIFYRHTIFHQLI